jgi:hypothetical protein
MVRGNRELKKTAEWEASWYALHTKYQPGDQIDEHVLGVERGTQGREDRSREDYTVGKLRGGKRPIGRPRRKRKAGLNMCLQEIGWERGMDSSGSGQRRAAGCCKHGDEHSDNTQCKFLTSWETISFSKRSNAPRPFPTSYLRWAPYWYSNSASYPTSPPPPKHPVQSTGLLLWWASTNIIIK